MENDAYHAPGTDKSALSIAIIRVEAMACGRRRDMRQLRELESPVGCRPRCEEVVEIPRAVVAATLLLLLLLLMTDQTCWSLKNLEHISTIGSRHRGRTT